MAALRPPFDLDEVQLFGAPDRLVRLPDRYLDTPPPSVPSRYEGSRLWLVRVDPAAGHPDFSIRWPADACTRAVDLTPDDASALGLPRLLELSLLPFAIADVLLAMPGGVPTFYLGYSGAPYPADDSAARTTDQPIQVTGAVLGIHFQDRVTLAPWAWFDRIAAAVRRARPADAAEWDAWSAHYAGRRSLRLLDPQGRPLPNQGITIAITDDAGNTVTTAAGISDADGDLPGLPLPGPNEKAAVSWEPDPPLAEQALPVMALVDAQADAVPGRNSFPLPSGFSGGHLQLLALSEWYAPNLHDDPESSALGARYRLHSRMEPIVDGMPSFDRLLGDLALAKGPGGAAHFAGWAFTDFPLQPGVERTSLFELGQDIIAAHGDVRILVAQFLQASPAALDTLSLEIGLALLVMIRLEPGLISALAGSDKTDGAGIVVWIAIVAAELILEYLVLVGGGEKIADAIRKVAEQTKPEFLAKLKTLDSDRFDARLSPHPVTFDDNPLSGDIPLPDGRQLRDLQDRFGIFHQKIQLVRHADAFNSANPYVAFVGGIDVNQNRLDSWGHHGAGYRKPDSIDPPTADPFHDVHSRITGPAVREVFEIFAQRYRRDAGSLPPTASPPLDQLGQPGREVMQVAQTSYKPRAGNVGFEWAPHGNATTHDTMVRAIRAAREYIYIEEQYLVADDEYIQALIDAGTHCQRLVIVLPTFLEVFFGDRRRGEMFHRMAATWGDRMLVGTPMRRPVLAPVGRVASVGRCTLLADIGPADAQLFIGPPPRVPKGRFFFWIGGELMFATGGTAVTGPGGQPATQLDVLRGGLGASRRWCPNPRAHAAGEPVTLSKPTGIFVHSKIMMVDDLFVCIGSTNVNRRGFFHDGEISAFSIPQELKTAAQNPARDLRTRLWAEQLGLAPDMGAALLADPIAGFELFRRSRYQGNRFTPLSELELPVPSMNDLPAFFDMVPPAVKQFIQFGLQLTWEALSDIIFNTVADPTTGIEPNPRPGPGLP